MNSSTIIETTSSSLSASSSPCDSEIEELQRLDSASPFWKSSGSILSKQLSLSETQHDLAWERKRHQMFEHERRRESTCSVPSGLFDEDLNELKGCIELGFGFNEEDGGQSLANMLPALDLYFAVNRIGSPIMSPTSTTSSVSKFSGFGSSSSKSLEEGRSSSVSSEGH